MPWKIGIILTSLSLLLGSTYYYKIKYEKIEEQYRAVISLINKQDNLIREQNKVYKDKVDKLNSQYEKDVNSLNSTVNSLRKQQSSSLLPRETSSTVSKNIQFRREELDRAIQRFRVGISELVGKGSLCEITIDSLQKYYITEDTIGSKN